MSVCSKETSRWGASFKQTKQTFAKKKAIHLHYTLTFRLSLCSVCLKEISFWDVPLKQTEDNPAWRTAQIHTLASQQSNTQNPTIYQNVPCSVYSKETSHRNTHLSTPKNRWIQRGLELLFCQQLTTALLSTRIIDNDLRKYISWSI